MKVSELTGATLDYWVARAEGLDPLLINGQWVIAATDEQRVIAQSKWVTIKRYSEVWDFGGPIIDREHIATVPWRLGGAIVWSAYSPKDKDGDEDCMEGVGGYFEVGTGDTAPTPLLAAMRCYVESKFGNEVEPPSKGD